MDAAPMMNQMMKREASPEDMFGSAEEEEDKELSLGKMNAS
jgi:hypothetical protein